MSCSEWFGKARRKKKRPGTSRETYNKQILCMCTIMLAIPFFLAKNNVTHGEISRYFYPHSLYVVWKNESGIFRITAVVGVACNFFCLHENSC